MVLVIGIVAIWVNMFVYHFLSGSLLGFLAIFRAIMGMCTHIPFNVPSFFFLCLFR